jgi:hypothetical protein
MVLIAFSAVNRATLCRLEWNFCLFATIRACDLMHLPGATVEILPSSITHIFHSFSASYTKKIEKPILFVYQQASTKPCY